MERSRRRTRRRPRPENVLNRKLRFAVYNDDEKEVENLIERGADVNSRDSDPNSGFSGEAPLHIASWGGNEEIARLLLNAGANPNLRDGIGETPLMKACFHRYPNIVKLLLDTGADVNVATKHGTTPLKYVLLLTTDRNGDVLKIVTMLIEAGANVKLSDIRFASYVSDETYNIVMNTYLRQQLTPLLSASARGEVFDPRLYDRRLWRIVGSYITKKD